MKRLITRPRSLLLVIALAVVTALCTVSTANAASTASETVVPAAPSSLTATAVSPTSVHLTWTNNAANQSGVVISRDGVESVDVQGATVSSYTWNGLSPGTKYWFYVASKIYGTPGDPTGSGNTQSAWVGPVYVTTLGVGGEQQPNWAGWSWYPQQGTVNLARAEWKVPKVDCSAPPPPKKAPDISRVAVWVGLWGPDSAGNNRWLPQIGTASVCTAGLASYHAIYQMYNGSGGGTTPNTLNLKGLKPGDTIEAEVSYAGTHSGRLQFNISIDDITRGSTTGGYIDTATNVPLVDAAYQGGAIVEDNGDTGDLAKFETPITISNTEVAGGSGGANTRWTMVVAGTQIAKTGDVSEGSFTVTWLNY